MPVRVRPEEIGSAYGNSRGWRRGPSLADWPPVLAGVAVIGLPIAAVWAVGDRRAPDTAVIAGQRPCGEVLVPSFAGVSFFFGARGDRRQRDLADVRRRVARYVLFFDRLAAASSREGF